MSAGQPHVDVSDPDGPPWLENRAPRRWRWPSLHELWAYRELVWFLAWRDLKVRYKQAGFGVAWAVIQPLVAAALFTFVFGRLGQVPSDGVPYPVFVYAGLIAWSYVSSTVTDATSSLVGNIELVTKVYVPRIVVPVATAIPGLVDLAIALVVLAVLMAGYGVTPGWALLLLPLWIVLLVVIAVGVGLIFAALNVTYRDTGHVITFGIQAWLLASPVAYPLSIVHGRVRMAYVLNPMVGALGAFRWSLLGTRGPGLELAVTIGVAVVLLVGAVLFFQSAERRFADVI